MALAQDPSPPEPQICLTVRYIWRGSQDERARIEAEPIPESFRRRFNVGCGSWGPESLLDWHLKHGNAQTARAALKFLEDNLSKPLDPDIVSTFTGQWSAELREFKEAFAAARSENAARTDQQIIHDVGRTFVENQSRLSDIRDDLYSFNFIASEYARAAEFFLSPELLKSARRYQAPTQAVSEFLEEQSKTGALEAYLADRAAPQITRFAPTAATREISLSVTTAAIRRDAASIEAADALTRSRYGPDDKNWPHPDMLTFLNQAYEEGADACEPDVRNSRPDYAKRCEENDFETEAFSYWYNRSRLELIAQRQGIELTPLDRPFSRNGSTPRTIDLFMRRAWEGGMRYGEEAAPPEVVRLLVWSAEAGAPTQACEDLPDGHEAEVWDAVEPLLWARTLSDPIQDPQLHRMVAETYLRIYDAAVRCGVEIDSPVGVRTAMLFRSFLAQYEGLIAAE